MPNIYQLSEQYKQFQEYANNVLEDETDEDTIQMLIDTLESVQDSLENKLSNTCSYLKNIEGDIAAYKGEEARIAKMRKSLENKYERIKQWMKDSLEANGIDKMNAGIFKVKIQANPPSVNVFDPSKIPNTYKIQQEPKVDSKSLLAALKSGSVIDGAELITDKKHVRFG